jgi:Transglycosylase-like domain
MRTRIALVAIIPIAVITISTLTLAASAQPARAVTTPASSNSGTATLVMPSDHLIAYQGITAGAPASTGSKLLFNAEGALSSFVTKAAPAPTAPAVTAPAPVVTPTDTVTPDQRAAWERVAMCEEGGNWAADGGRFSGGLGISRTNWIAYGGGEYASSGAQATEDQQIMVAERIQSSPPDQYGCGSW